MDGLHRILRQMPPENQHPMALDRPLVRAAIALALFAAIGVAFLAVRAARGDDKIAAPTLNGARTPAGTPSPEAGLGPLDGRAPIIGQPAPDFILRDVEGATVKLSDLRGRVVWVNFWATWCVPCKKELPVLQKLADEKKDAGLVVLAINWQESADDARAYFASRGLTLPVLLDRGGVYDQYKLQGLPDSFFIDRDGVIATLQYGEVSEKKARERLATAGLP